MDPILSSASDVVGISRYSKAAQQYARYRESVDAILRSGDSKHRDMVSRANEGITRLKALNPGNVHQDSILTNLSVKYANSEYIGLSLMPVVQVGKQSGTFFTYDKRDRLAYPDDDLGPRGSANEIDEHRSTGSYFAKSYGLKNYVDGMTLANEDAPLNEMVDLVESVNEAIAFREELRIAAILGTAGNFGGNTTALGSTVRWDDAGSNPVGDIQSAIAALWNGRGRTKLVAYTSLDVWNVLSRNSQILDLFKYNGSSPGLATPQMFAQWFGIKEIYIGASRKDTANVGAAASYARIWPDVFGIVRVAEGPSLRNAAFGYTLRWGEKRTDEWFDISLGTMGGYYARTSVSEDHKIIAPDTGYLITTVIG
jgi:hypothetical protein